MTPSTDLIYAVECVSATGESRIWDVPQASKQDADEWSKSLNESRSLINPDGSFVNRYQVAVYQRISVYA